MSEFKDVAGLIRDYFEKNGERLTDKKDVKILNMQLEIIRLQKIIKKLGGNHDN